VDGILEKGGIAVLPIDICGALALKNRYRGKALLVFLDRKREEVLMDIVARDLSPWDKTCRILSLDDELRNEELCDLTLRVSGCINALADSLAATVAAGPVHGE
jgi:guanylate kinase